MKLKSFLFLITIFISFMACSEKSDDINLDNEAVVINATLYKNTQTNNYTITNISKNGNLLTIKISSSGCSGDSWKAILVDANVIMESNPIQRNIKLSLENKEACLAIFEKEFIFDISILKENFPEIILNLEGWNQQIQF